MRFKYTSEQAEFLREGYLLMRIPELARAFNDKYKLNKSDSAIKAALKNRNITCGRKKGNPVGSYSLLTKEQFDFVSENYKTLSIKDLTINLNEKFNTSFTGEQIKTFTTNHGIKSGRTGCFKKGCVTWNKGVTGYMGANKTSFKKGQVPKNITPIGTERICSKDGYILIKVNEPNPYTAAKTRYKFKHIVVWEKENGPLPKNRVVIFLDGNKLNCEPENLDAITRSELLYLNRHGYHNLPDELKPNMLSLAKLETKRFNLEKQV